MSAHFPLDNLPSDIILHMIQKDPTLIKALNQTSRRFRGIVGSYAAGGALLAVKLMMSRPTPAEGDPQEDLRLRVYVPARLAGLFEVRLNQLIVDLGIEIGTLCIRCASDFQHGRVVKMYSITVRTLATAQYLAEYVIGTRDRHGVRIEEVIIDNFLDNDARISAILHGRTWPKLSIFADSLQDASTGYIDSLITGHSVQELYLSCVHTDALTDHRASIRLLASHSRTMRIVQRPVPGVAPNAAYFLGLIDADWSSIILSMYAGGSLEGLHVDNRFYPEFLPRAAADALRAALPFLGRSIKFRATCTAYEDGIDEVVGNHRVVAHSRRMGIRGPRLLEVMPL